MGLPQHDGQNSDLQRLDREGHWPQPGKHLAVRTEAEESLFKKALVSMEMLYSVGGIPVIVLPAGGSTAQGHDYLSRGWCFLEFCLAFSFGNIANAEIDPAVETLCDTVRDLKADTVEGFHKTFKRTRFTCGGDDAVVLRLFKQTLKACP